MAWERCTTERRITAETTSARKAYQSFENGQVRVVKGATNPEDGLTKKTSNGALKRILGDQLNTTEVAECIAPTVRPSKG